MNDKPKVLIISHMYLSTFDHITFFVHDQVKELKKQGCEVKVICPLPWVPPLAGIFLAKWKKYSDVPKKMIWDGIEVYYPRYMVFPKNAFFCFSGMLMYAGIRKIVRFVSKNFRFDIIHSHVIIPDGFAGMELSRQCGKPLIVTVHGQDFQQTIIKGSNCRKNIKKVINYAYKVLVVSSKLGEIARNKLNVSVEKIQVLPNGIEKKMPVLLPKNLDIKELKGRKIILSISNLICTKGIDFNIKCLADLVKKNHKIIYLVIGDGPEKKNLQTLANHLGVRDYVRFLGQLPHEQAMGYLSRCDVFSLPSWNEGFGVVYLEAMSFGKPIIACKGEGIDGVIIDEENGFLVKPKDVKSLAEKIDFLISNPVKAAAIGKNGRILINERYTWDKIVFQLLEVYKEAIEQNEQ